MPLNNDFLLDFTGVVSVGTACKPGMNMLAGLFGADYQVTSVSDGFCLFQKCGAVPQDIEAVFVAHVDEIGGCAYGPTSDGWHSTRCWGTKPAVYHEAQLQAMDYLAETDKDCMPVESRLVEVDGEERLEVRGDAIRPYRTVFTFNTKSHIVGDSIYGKALDPRITTYAVCEAVRRLNSNKVAAMIVMAEECAMDVARKGVTFLYRNAPNLKLVTNADVPWIENIGEGNLELPAIRVFEGRNFIDPAFGIRTAERLQNRGVALHLSAARSGSQTLLFTPLAPTLSIALPSDGIHAPQYRMSLVGASRCVDLLTAIGDSALDGSIFVD